ncbi:MAG: hypothetical protein JSR54_03505 [Proteobacteria bacterium]|nr:hypothetical protein [Pseudomonadota bacterium]
MRLLDLIARAEPHLPVMLERDLHRLPGAGAFAPSVASCPLRLVLSEPLTALCAALAYADGDRLTGCLDLVHVPARRLWVEWPDAPRADAAAVHAGSAPSPPGGTAGAYLETDASGRCGTLRTFWCGPGPRDEAQLAPLATEFDLDGAWTLAAEACDVYGGGVVRLASEDPALAQLLDCARFRFDPAWAAYYRRACPDSASREDVLRRSLASVGTDLPLLLALFLLMNSRAGLPQRPVSRARLNQRRRDRAPLLDHVEVFAPAGCVASGTGGAPAGGRRPVRLHHVRGHLVRRGSVVHWRVAHLRGRATFGRVHTRTLTLRAPDLVSVPPSPAGLAGGHRAGHSVAAQGVSP